MWRALPLVIGQLGDPVIRRVLLRSLLATLALFAAAWWALDSAVAAVDPARLPAWMAAYWATGTDWLALPVVLIAGWFLFPAVATAVIGLFLDDVVDAVEARHYGQARSPRRVGWGEAGLLAAASAVRLLAWNLLLLPAYIALLFTAIGPAILFLALNAWLLGRDFLEMAAARHLPPPTRRGWVAGHRGRRAGVGLASALLFLVPIANLLAPIVGAMLGAHAFHSRRPETAIAPH